MLRVLGRWQKCQEKTEESQRKTSKLAGVSSEVKTQNFPKEKADGGGRGDQR